MSEDQAKSFIEQATSSIQSGNFSQAIEFLDQAAELAPNDSEVSVLKGICLSQSGRAPEATAAFRKAITQSPYNAKAYFNLAVHLYGLGDKVEALQMAEEAAKIDVRHAGARQLMEKIQNEANPVAAAKSAYNPADPLSSPPPGEEGVEAPKIQSPTAPNAPTSPYAAQGTQSSYMRPGYEAAEADNIAFVGKMGGGWLAIAWVLVAMSLLALGLSISTSTPMIQAMMAGNTAEAQRLQAAAAGNVGLSFLSYGATLGIILWTILDLINRRGNFVWLIPQVLCSCCGFGWLVMPIYILAGRK